MKVLDIMKLSEKERLAYEWHIEETRYRASMDRSRFMDGHFEGRKEGRQEGITETARLMKQAGEPVEKIAAYTRLTPEEIEAA